ncbi:hypothetical protein CC2G_002579 [Coprinopsis cinerea AmutBmut pab1-1]|nr:hypothetical protein CC2G_002579 [Coprinopsis cinerea AmutBmut pab1-1]
MTRTVVTVQPSQRRPLSPEDALRALPSVGSDLNLLSSVTNIEDLDLHEGSLTFAQHTVHSTARLIEALQINATRQNNWERPQMHRDSEDCECDNCVSWDSDDSDLVRRLPITIFVTRTVFKYVTLDPYATPSPSQSDDQAASGTATQAQGVDSASG